MRKIPQATPVALQAYCLIKLTGGAEGLQAMRGELGSRFAKASRPSEAKAA